jgi:MoaA/NifB/PqqE/SkfB family radical SAM enzyme
MSQFENNDAFCPLPWNGVYLSPDGDIDTCCISDNKLGNLNSISLGDALASQKNISIKTDMLAEKKVNGCTICYKNQSSANDNQRLKHIRNIDRFNFNANLYNDVNAVELNYLDLRFKNTCNYACVYCDPMLSSSWAAELKQIPIIARDTSAETLDFILKNISTVNSIYLAGGEPLLMKENEIILESLITINPNCNIIVNTNLSQTSNNRIFELLQKFNNVQWVVSVDDTEDRYNYIRYPGDWNVFQQNLLIQILMFVLYGLEEIPQ